MKSVDEPISVLIVDDDSDLRRTISDILRVRGYETHTAANAEDGLALAKELAPVVVLIDLRLPDMNGIELVSRLHAASVQAEIVIMTGNASVESAVSAFRNETFDYLVKPVRPDDLITTIERAGERFQRKRAEAAQRDSENQLRRIFDAVHEGLLITAADGSILQVNPALSSMAARAPGELESMRVEALFKPVEATTGDPVEPMLMAFRNALLVRPDGELRRVEVDVTGFAPDRFVYVVRDVTAHRALEDQLRVVQKMEALGRLAGGVAHDFNNVLTAIRGYADLLRDECSDAHAVDHVNEIRNAAERAGALTRQLLAFSRRQVLQPRIIEVCSVISSMEDMLRRLIREDITLTLNCHEPGGRVRADPGQLEQIVLNLVVNARDAMPSGGEIRVDMGRVQLNHAQASRLNASAIAGTYATICVADQGQGIAQDVLPHIFEPFFTTKEAGLGTGLGLSTVHGVVQQTLGFVTVDSVPGKGTSLTVYIPHIDAPVDAELPKTEPLAGGRPASERILVVEDDDAIRRMVVRVLQREGYDVSAAASGTEALALANAGLRPDLLFTDIVLPGMNGLQLAREVRASVPGVRVVYTSGYAENELGESVVATDIAFVPKPFMTSQLLRAIRDALDAEVATA